MISFEARKLELYLTDRCLPRRPKSHLGQSGRAINRFQDQGNNHKKSCNFLLAVKKIKLEQWGLLRWL